jgi:hypothetical protein
MHDDKLNLRSVLRSTTTESVPEEETGLPLLMDGEYQPYGRPANKPLYSIHFIDSSREIRSFQYVHLDSDSTYSPDCITLRFLGMEPVKVSIHGRNLWRLHDYIHQHRVPWILEAARDLARDGQPIVTEVVFADVTAD